MNRSMRFASLTLAVFSLLPISVFAHTDAGHTTGFAAGFGHPITGLDHLLAMVAVGLWAAQMGGRAIWAVPSAFVALMIIGGILAIFGIQIPYVEEGILVSVLVLGVLIAAAFKFPVAISAVIVGIFAVFHGHAHGAEMPLAIGAVGYCLGFALGTALLHAMGLAGGMLLQQMNVNKLARFAGGAIAFGGIWLAMV